LSVEQKVQMRYGQSEEDRKSNQKQKEKDGLKD